MAFLTKFSGIVLFAMAAAVIAFAVVDTAPEATNAAKVLRRGGPTSSALPIATSVKYKIGTEVVFDVMVLGLLGMFGWFLYTSEVQQTWGVVTIGLLVAMTIAIRSTPLLSMDIGKHSAGCAFWGAYVVDDFYMSGPRDVQTFPMTRSYRFVYLSRATGTTARPGESVVLDFGGNQSLVQRWDGMPGGAKVTGKLAGTRTILDKDNKNVVYSVPHLMVEEVESIGSGGG